MNAQAASGSNAVLIAAAISWVILASLALLLGARYGKISFLKAPGSQGRDHYDFPASASSICINGGVGFFSGSGPIPLVRATFDERHLRLRARPLSFFTDVAIDRDEVLAVEVYPATYFMPEMRFVTETGRLRRVRLIGPNIRDLARSLEASGWPVS